MFASPQERKPGQGFDCYGGAAERALTVRYSALQAATVACFSNQQVPVPRIVPVLCYT